MNKLFLIMKKRNLIFTITFLIPGLLLLNACSSSERNNNSIPETNSFTDPRDGKIYKTVKVGDQWIMAENLAYKPDKGNYWAYENDTNNAVIYGYLYDWETAMNITPDGWHLPSRKEWMSIQKKLGVKWNVLSYLEKIYPRLIVGGSSGLDMLFGGMRTCDGKYIGLGDKARFWTSIHKKDRKACYGLNRIKAGIPDEYGRTRSYIHNNGYQINCPGYSVRLFMD